MLRQLGLLPAGCQPWNSNMIAGTRSKFAYCSTMAVYIYEMVHGSHEYKLTAIIAEHSKTITSIAWNAKFPNLIATSGADYKIVIWDVSKHKILAQLPNLKLAPCCIDWVNVPSEQPTISYIGTTGYLETWNITTGKISTRKNIAFAGTTPITVIKWHHTRLECVAFGHSDGTVSVFAGDKTASRKKIVKFREDCEINDKVLLISWDPLSNDYLLVANKLSGVRLVDTSSASVVTIFCMPSRAITTNTFSWIDSAPGMFLTGDRETGVLRLWTVGQEQPLENFRVKPMGFNGIHVLDCPKGIQVYDENLAYGSFKRKPSQSQTVSHSVPPASVVCTFRDGGVGLYDLQKKKWLFLKDQGHIETIFDCKFKPDDPKVLATASFDGTIKMWSTTDLSPITTSAGNEGVIYSISWAPENLNCIVCGTRRKGVFIWDFNKSKLIKRFAEHGTCSVYCVAWNQLDSHRIASASEDCACVIRRADGQDMQKLFHPAPVYGCDWSPFNKSLIATGCEDGSVRIWDTSAPVKCVNEMKGHMEKVFNVRWHPLVKTILCSGSDDCTICIWNVTSDSSCGCIGVLKGHSGRVRGLSWNYEIPYLLVSGSWDSTICLWDVRNPSQKSLSVIKDHGADVYGLASHPSTPFMMASTSRDSTVRLWTLASTLSSLFAKVLVGHPFDDILCTPDKGFEAQSGFRLAGKISKQITDELRQRPNSVVVKLRWFSELFCATPSLENLWDVACYSMGAKETSLSSDYKTGILHLDHLVKYKAAEAQELELSCTAKLQAGNRQQEGILEKAAAIHLKLGNLKRHCEILKLLGRWETALSLAAGVSVQYWRHLAKEYAELLEESCDGAYQNYRIAIGDATKCIQDLTKTGDFDDALLIAQSVTEHRMPSTSTINHALTNGDTKLVEGSHGNEDESALDHLRSDCVKNLSGVKYSNGDPCKAATHKLSIGDKIGAIECLVQGNELLLALCLGQALKCNSEEAVVLYSRKLEGQDNCFFAVDMLRNFTDSDVSSTWSVIHASCARYNGDLNHRENLQKYAGVSSPEKYFEEGEKYYQSKKLHYAMNCFLLSTQPSRGLELGVELLCQELSNNNSWSLSTITDLEPVFSVSSSVLIAPDNHRLKNALLAAAAYIGALKALRHGFLSVVAPLFEHAIAMTERLEIMSGDGNNAFPMQSSEVKHYLDAWKIFYSRICTSNEENICEVSNSEIFQSLLERAEIDVCSIAANETVVAGSSLPSHSDVHISSLTNKRIYGPVFRLEQGTTVVSINEAIMWARVNEFSPTGSGQRIIPF